MCADSYIEVIQLVWFCREIALHSDKKRKPTFISSLWGKPSEGILHTMIERVILWRKSRKGDVFREFFPHLQLAPEKPLLFPFVWRQGRL